MQSKARAVYTMHAHCDMVQFRVLCAMGALSQDYGICFTWHELCLQIYECCPVVVNYFSEMGCIGFYLPVTTV